ERGALNEAGQLKALAPGPPPKPPLHAVPPAVIELVPEAVAREHVILSVALDGGTLSVATADHKNIRLGDKLGFILNKKIRFIRVPHELIVPAINYYYGQIETEALDSLLQELNDTTIARSAKPSIALDDPTVSRRHAKTMLARSSAGVHKEAKHAEKANQF